MSENTVVFSNVDNRELDKLIALVNSAKTAKLKKEREQAVKQYIEKAEYVLIFADSYTRLFNSAKTLRRFLRHNGYRTNLLTKTINDKNQNVWTHALAYTGKYSRITNNTETIRDYEKEALEKMLAESKKEQAESKSKSK